MAVEEHGPLVSRFLRWRISPEERRAVLDAVALRQTKASLWRFAVLQILAVTIAVMGLVTDSAAVVIGAMLVAPLMSPIMGVAASLSMGWIARAARTMLLVLVAAAGSVALAYLLTSFVPGSGLTAEVLARTSPGATDMVVALAAGLAGAYATVRPNVSASLAGVAVAVALVPPLAAVGVALQAGEMGLAQGALLLFFTNLSAIVLAVLAERAGIPAGVFNVVPSSSASSIGKEFCENPKIRKLTFTGSTEVGRILLKQAADQVMKCSMELGGNAPFIVFDDADLDAAVEGAILCKFRNNGQTCVCANRIYVQSGVYDAFAQKLAARVSKMKVGDGLEEGTDLGPLINPEAAEKVYEHIEDATAKGGSILLGGKKDNRSGNFLPPTIVTGVTQEMKVAKEETFGPFAPLFKFDTVDDVIEMANDTIFGLASYFYARDLSRVTKVAEALEYGIVGVNTGIISTEVAPFGGVKQSGLGREGSHHGIEDYLEMKYICIAV